MVLNLPGNGICDTLFFQAELKSSCDFLVRLDETDQVFLLEGVSGSQPPQPKSICRDCHVVFVSTCSLASVAVSSGKPISAKR